MKRALSLTVPLSLGLIVAASALITSRSACACVSSAQVVAMAAGYSPSWEEAPEIDYRKIEAGLKQRLIGQKPNSNMLFPSEQFGCNWTDSTSMNCFVPTHESWAIAKGWLVQFKIAPDGTLIDVSVSKHWGHRPNNSFKPTPLRGAA